MVSLSGEPQAPAAGDRARGFGRLAVEDFDPSLGQMVRDEDLEAGAAQPAATRIRACRTAAAASRAGNSFGRCRIHLAGGRRQRRRTGVRHAVQSVAAIIQLIGSLAILAWVDWTLLSGALVLLPTVFFTHRAWINSIRPQFRVIRKQRELIDAGATESFAGMRIVPPFSRQKREAGSLHDRKQSDGPARTYAWWWMRVVEMVWETLIPIASAGLLFYGGWRVLEGHMTVGDLMMFLVYLLMLLEPLATLAQRPLSFKTA